MIHVNYQNDKELQRWYVGQIRASRKKPSPMPGSIRRELRGLKESLSSLSPQAFEDILLKKRPLLEKTYAWIEEYGKLCDFVTYYPLLKEQAEKSRFYWDYPKLRQDYLGQYKGFYLESLIDGLSSSPNELIRSWANFNRLKKAAHQCLEEANLLIREFFDYSMMSQETRHELFRKMCPYARTATANISIRFPWPAKNPTWGIWTIFIPRVFISFFLYPCGT